MRAVVAFALLVCIHPFADGNGRTDWVLFNLVLWRGLGLPDRNFVPLKQLFALSDDGDLIRLRAFAFGDDWDSFIRFVCDCLHVAVVVGASDGSASRFDAPAR